MKHLRILLLLLLLSVSANAQLVTATLTVTNNPIANTDFIAVGTPASTTLFNWTNSTPVAHAMLATNTLGGNATNLLSTMQLSLPFVGITPTQTAGTVLTFRGIGISITPSVGWASVVLSTNTTGPGTNILVPISNYDSPVRAPAESQLASDLSQYSTYSIPTNATLLLNYVDLFNPQTLFNKKLTNAIIFNSTFVNPVMTNAQNYGAPFRSPGTGIGSEQFGINSIATGNGSVAIGDNTSAAGSGTAVGAGAIVLGGGVAYGNGSEADLIGGVSLGTSSLSGGTNSTAIGANTIVSQTGSTAIGAGAVTTSAHQIMIGTASEYIRFPGNVSHAGVDTNLTTGGSNTLGGNICYKATNLTSLVNGNNTLLTTGQHDLILSGPTSAFTITGVVAIGLDRQEVTIENSTGFTMTIANQSGAETAANRIQTGSGSDLALTSSPGEVTLVYNVTSSRWTIKSHN